MDSKCIKEFYKEYRTFIESLDKKLKSKSNKLKEETCYIIENGWIQELEIICNKVDEFNEIYQNSKQIIQDPNFITDILKLEEYLNNHTEFNIIDEQIMKNLYKNSLNDKKIFSFHIGNNKLIIEDPKQNTFALLYYNPLEKNLSKRKGTLLQLNKNKKELFKYFLFDYHQNKLDSDKYFEDNSLYNSIDELKPRISIMLFYYEKNFIDPRNLFSFYQKYYLINKKWMDEFKKSIKYKEISDSLNKYEYKLKKKINYINLNIDSFLKKYLNSEDKSYFKENSFENCKPIEFASKLYTQDIIYYRECYIIHNKILDLIDSNIKISNENKVNSNIKKNNTCKVVSSDNNIFVIDNQTINIGNFHKEIFRTKYVISYNTEIKLEDELRILLMTELNEYFIYNSCDIQKFEIQDLIENNIVKGKLLILKEDSLSKKKDSLKSINQRDKNNVPKKSEINKNKEINEKKEKKIEESQLKKGEEKFNNIKINENIKKIKIIEINLNEKEQSQFKNGIEDKNDNNENSEKQLPINSSLESDLELLNNNKGIIGLNKVGGVPYMNAILQCLIQTKSLTVSFLKESNKIKTYSEDEYELSKSYLTLIKKIWGINKNIQYNPYNFKNVVISYDKSFNKSNSDKIKDFIDFILGKLHQELKKNKINEINEIKNISNNSDKKIIYKYFLEKFEKDNSIISKELFGIVETSYKCLECNNNLIYYDYEILKYIIFNLEEIKSAINSKINKSGNNKITIDDCFQTIYNNNEFIREKNYFCYNCKKSTRCKYYLKLVKLPNTLIIILDRNINKMNPIEFDFYNEIKIMQRDESENSNNQEISYNLNGVVTCINQNEPTEQHFVSFCKNQNNKYWYKYDNIEVSEPINDTQKDIIEYKTPFVCFYNKKV